MSARIKVLIFVLCTLNLQFAFGNVTSVTNPPTGFGMRFRMPFIDIDIQSISNLKIIKDATEQRVYILHGAEFYQLILDRGFTRITLIATLNGDVRQSELLGAEIITWQNYVILVLAVDEHLEVYQFAKKAIEEQLFTSHGGGKTSLVMDPIQQITFYGRYKGLCLCKSSQNAITLVVLVNFSKLYSRVNVYSWAETYFDPSEENTIAPAQIWKIIGSEAKYLVMGRVLKSQSKVTVIIYRISSSLKQTQAMSLSSKVIHPFTYHSINYLISCAADKKCTLYKMVNEQFSALKCRSAPEFNFNRFTAGNNFLVGQRGGDVSVFVDSRMECYGTFKTLASDVTSIMTHLNDKGYEFVLVVYIRPLTTLIRVIEIEYEPLVAVDNDNIDELGAALKRHRHAFEESISRLRKILLNRKHALDEIKRYITFVERRRKEVEFLSPVRILSGSIKSVQLIDSNLCSPLQILQSVKNITSGQRRTRFSREFDSDINKSSKVGLKVKSLRVGNLIYDGNLVTGFNLSADDDHLRISVPVTTKVLKTRELFTASIMESGASQQAKSRSLDESVIRIKTLKANRINGVLWNDFIENVFLRSRNQSISGRLIMQSDVQVNKLYSLFLNSLPVEKILNLVQDQNITSNLVVSRAFINDLVTNRLNGLDFARDVARIGIDNFIETPVTALDIKILNKLILAEEDHQARHIFGTSVLDFHQMYTGQVRIKGSLTIVDLKIETEGGAQLIVDESEISIDLSKNFWMRSKRQIFDFPVLFTNCNISAIGLSTSYVNDWPVIEYLQKTNPQGQKPVLLIFLSAFINGSLFADPTFGTKLQEISNKAIRRNQTSVVSGKKTFKGSLRIDHLELNRIGDILPSELVSLNEKNCVFKGRKSFKSIHIVNDAVISENLDIAQFGGNINISDLFQTDLHFDSIVMSTPLTVKNIIFDYFNGFSWNRLFSGIQSVDDKLLLDRDLYVEGSIQFDANLYVDVINHIDWEEYLSSIIRVNDNSVITGMKIIDSTLIIATHLNSTTINDVLIDQVFDNVLLKSHYQAIQGVYTFDTIRLNNVNVSFINEFPTNAFIDTRLPKIVINGDVSINNLLVQGSLFGLIDMDLYTLVHRIKAMAYQSWKNLRVVEDAFWPWGADQHSLDLKYLYENAVRHLDDQVITGNVRLRKPLITTMNTKHVFPTEIDFDIIAMDCLFYNSSASEVVTAAKTFNKPIQISEAASQGHLGSKIVNSIDIIRFNSSLYRFGSLSTITGPVVFQTPPIFVHLTVQGMINQVMPSKIFTSEDDKVLPPVKVKSLHVDQDLRLHRVNQIIFDSFMRDRVLKSGDAQEVLGHLTFEHLILEKHIDLQSINNIAIDNIIQRHSGNRQDISGHKTVLGDLQLVGETTVSRLNGEDLIEIYRNSIFLNKNYHFEGLSLESAKFENGLIIKAAITTHSHVNKPYESIHKEYVHKHQENLKRILNDFRAAEDVIDMKIMNPKKLVYLDYDFSTTIEWKSSNDTIQEHFVFDNNRYQLCDREKTVVKWSKHHNRILLNKFKTNIIKAEEYAVKVTAENKCKDSYRKGISLIKIAEPHFTKSFQINKLVQSIDIFYASDIFILIHAIDMYAGINEIRTFKIDNNYKTIQDWQLLIGGVGKVSKLFKLPTHTILLVSTVIENYPSTTVYNLNSESRTFEAIQIIDGDFDVIELAQVTPYTYHLLLSCIHCQRIVIFEYDSRSLWAKDYRMYRIYQIIKLKTRIDRLTLFTLPDGGIYLLVLSDQDIDFYHVYQYRYIQGWQHFTYGYFKNILNAYPLLKNGISCVDDNLLLLCNRKCTLVKAFYQG